MGFAETVFIYLVIGAVVASANFLLGARAGLVKNAIAFAAAVPFWPFFAPALLARPRPPPVGPRDASLEGRIAGAEASLIDALRSLSGLPEDVLAPEVERVRGLGRALRTMAHRAAEMRDLLSAPEFSRERAARTLAELDQKRPAPAPLIASVRARIANIERLEAMLGRTIESLERALLEVEEIGSRMALLRFADHPEEEVVRIIRDIAMSVEGAAELTVDS